MSRWIKYLASMGAVVVFLLLALACSDEDDGEPIPCDPIDERYYENGYFTCNSIPFTSKQNDVKLTVLDRATGAPLEGIYVKVSWNLILLDTVNCDGQCFGLLEWGSLDYSGAFSEITDASGQIDVRTGTGYHWDARDVQLVSLRIEDLSGKYAPRLVSARFTHSVSSIEKTVYLLNNESL